MENESGDAKSCERNRDARKTYLEASLRHGTALTGAGKYEELDCHVNYRLSVMFFAKLLPKQLVISQTISCPTEDLRRGFGGLDGYPSFATVQAKAEGFPGG